MPVVNQKRLAVRVTAPALRHIKMGHPWVYDGSITSVSHDGAPGDLAVIFDEDRKFVGIGLWDPASPIRIKMLHRGSPATIDAAWWHQKLAAAVEARASLWPATTGYRVVNGESDGFPGLVLDRYADVYVMKLYSTAWLPHLADVVEAITALLSPEALVLRFGRRAERDDTFGLVEGRSLIGPTQTDAVVFVENGLHFEADVINGQKTGHFLDQRDNRQRVRELASRARVLDVFSCTGGFSLYAAAGGAREVHSVDIAPEAMQTAKRNFELNQSVPAVAACRHLTTVGDAFSVLRKQADAGERYDIVVIDPPSFASKQSSIDAGLNSYRQLTMLGTQLLNSGGLLVQASCSSRIDADRFYATVHDGAASVNVTLTELERTGHGIDHPATFAEADYLKALFAKVS